MRFRAVAASDTLRQLVAVNSPALGDLSMVELSDSYLGPVIVPPRIGEAQDVRACRDALTVKFSSVALSLPPRAITGSETEFHSLREIAKATGWDAATVARCLSILAEEWMWHMKPAGILSIPKTN